MWGLIHLCDHWSTSVRYLRDCYVPGWQALEIEAEMSGIQSLPFNERYTRGIEIAVGMWRREPEYT